VALVLGLLLASAPPRLQRGWARVQMERTAFELAQSLRTARTVAITQSQPVEWVWDSDARAVWLGAQQPDGSTAPLPGRFGQPHPVPVDVDLTVVQSGQPVQQVTFLPNGTSQSTTLLIGDPTAPRYQVAVNGSTSQVVVH